ncbi:MAG TPA: hypothetical protein VE650_08975 [Acetobacteraceae bacterium]|nr:hypothetical protein [Acetobacteraceae bacterium]
MNRHSNFHKASRVELPVSLHWNATDDEQQEVAMARQAMLSGVSRVIGRIGVLTCALVVVGLASLLAMRVG